MPYFEFLGCRGPFCETRFLLLGTSHFEKIQVVGHARMRFAAWMAPNREVMSRVVPCAAGHGCHFWAHNGHFGPKCVQPANSLSSTKQAGSEGQVLGGTDLAPGHASP